MPTPRSAVPTGLRRSLASGALAGLAALAFGCKGNDPKVETTPSTPVPQPFVLQPKDQTVTSGQSATFGVVAAVEGPVGYQWNLNGAAIAGANSSTYMTSALSPINSGSTISVTLYTANVQATSNAALLTVVASGVVTPFAGSTGVPGSGNGTGAGASFSAPSALVADAAGNLYVADTNNSVIRKITAGGTVSTFAGTAGVVGHADATGASASFDHPAGIAIDGSGNLFVSDSGNRIIRQITPGGVVSTLAGTAGVYGHADGTGAAASFAYPQGIAVDASGTLFVVDAYNNTIRKIAAGGVVTTLAGSAGSVGGGDNASGASATFNHPQGLAIDGSGNLYVADSGNHTIRKVTSAGGVSTLAGLAGNGGRADGTTTSVRFWQPAGIAIDGSGNLYVSETGNRAIRKVTAAGAVTTQAGSPTLTGTVDGTGSAVSFRNPAAVTVDSSGNVFIADASDHIVRKLVPGS